jgi:hypothetical protein
LTKVLAILRSNRQNPETKYGTSADEWRSQLSEAAIEGDSNRVMGLIQAIPDKEFAVIKILEKFARQFEFDEIVELLNKGNEG